MPELAEVEFYRKQWDCGLNAPILAVHLHPGKRIFRGQNLAALRRLVPGAKLVFSEARGKQMLFRFSNHAWLGLHLGMTGTLRADQSALEPGRHDHLVLRQKSRSLVLNDPRCFGRVLFHVGANAPEWWAKLPPPINSGAFTRAGLAEFLQGHGRAPLKAVLLRQDGFPGVGNWMADEILWQTGLHPRTPAGRLHAAQVQAVWRVTRFVCRVALQKIGKDWSDPPAGWFFHERWAKSGRCPRHRAVLERATVGGRTTAWCAQCQARG